MKITNTYKHYTITWFNYKHLFKLSDDGVCAHKKYPESTLMSWIENPHLNVSIRKPYNNIT